MRTLTALALTALLAGCATGYLDEVDPRVEACSAHELAMLDVRGIVDAKMVPEVDQKKIAALLMQQTVLCDLARPAGPATAALIVANTARIVQIVWGAPG